MSLTNDQPAQHANVAQPPATEPEPARRKPRPLSWRGRLVLLLFSLVLLLMLEGAVRLAGFGGATPLWSVVLENHDTGQQILESTPYAGSIFFAAPTRSGVLFQGNMHEHRVEMPKPAGTLRVLVVGESSVQGFPWRRYLAFPAMLERQLSDAIAGDVEVINAGMTAVASYPVRRMCAENIAAIAPDVVVIYTGHNEFFGAFGVASIQAGARTIMGMHGLTALRRTGLYQALEHLHRRMRGLGPSGGERVRIIEEMAGTESIEPGGDLHRRARDLFEANMRAMIRHAQAHGSTVVVATVVSNESGMLPVRVYAPEGSEARAVAEQARGMLLTPDLAPEDALAMLATLAAQHPQNAMIPHIQGKFLDRAGRRAEAIAYYRRAVDLDAMPWRAPTFINEVARSVAEEEGAILADVETFIHESTQRGIGWNLMIDHLHPNLEGNAVIARVIRDAIVENMENVGGTGNAAPTPDELPEAFLARMRANTLEQVDALTTCINLFRNPPLNTNNEHIAAHLQQKLLAILEGFTPVEHEAMRRRDAMMAETGGQPAVSQLGMWAALDTGNVGAALPYAEAAFADALPYSIEWLRFGFFASLMKGNVSGLGDEWSADVRELLAAVEVVKALAPSNAQSELLMLRGGLEAMSGNLEEGRGLIQQALVAGFVPHRSVPILLGRLAQEIVGTAPPVIDVTPPSATAVDEIPM